MSERWYFQPKMGRGSCEGSTLRRFGHDARYSDVDDVTEIDLHVRDFIMYVFCK